MTTYKQLQDSWIRSEWVNNGVEDFGEGAPVIIPAGFVSVTLEDLIKKRVKKKNYHDIVKLADYIMVENVDPILDEIVEVTDNVHIVYEFEDFYRLSERLKPLTREQLEEQIKEFNKTNLEMFYYYGHSSFWNVSKITNMENMFSNSKFNGDLSKWDVSNVTNMNGMFSFSKFNGDISKWDVSNVTNMEMMFEKSHFNGDISQWDVSNVTKMAYMFWGSKFNGDISKWDVSNVTDMQYMFNGSEFKGDISKWVLSQCYIKPNDD